MNNKRTDFLTVHLLPFSSSFFASTKSLNQRDFFVEKLSSLYSKYIHKENSLIKSKCNSNHWKLFEDNKENNGDGMSKAMKMKITSSPYFPLKKVESTKIVIGRTIFSFIFAFFKAYPKLWSQETDKYRSICWDCSFLSENLLLWFLFGL